ncbi:hypothetical protein KAR04_04050, partial [Candidatus Calescamantes bacterium]|nr:hypothetical protein [Candidatus Calescamantes bacterium]
FMPVLSLNSTTFPSYHLLYKKKIGVSPRTTRDFSENPGKFGNHSGEVGRLPLDFPGGNFFFVSFQQVIKTAGSGGKL